MEEELKRIFKVKFNFEEYRYFYHITGKGVGIEIMEFGLGMSDPNYYSTMIEITEDDLKDPVSFLTREYKKGLMPREEMVIIGVPLELGDNFIRENEEEIPDWNSSDEAKYMVPNDLVMGYFDLETLDFLDNYNYGGDEEYRTCYETEKTF